MMVWNPRMKGARDCTKSRPSKAARPPILQPLASEPSPPDRQLPQTLLSEQEQQCVPEPNFRKILLVQNHRTGPVVDGTNFLGCGPQLTSAVVPNTVVVCVGEAVNSH